MPDRPIRWRRPPSREPPTPSALGKASRTRTAARECAVAVPPRYGTLLAAIAGWMRAMPVPGGAHDRLERAERRRPPELAPRLVRRRIESGGIARSSRAERPRYV